MVFTVSLIALSTQVGSGRTKTKEKAMERDVNQLVILWRVGVPVSGYRVQ